MGHRKDHLLPNKHMLHNCKYLNQTLCIPPLTGRTRFYDNMEDMLGFRINPWIGWCWCFFAPAFCLVRDIIDESYYVNQLKNYLSIEFYLRAKAKLFFPQLTATENRKMATLAEEKAHATSGHLMKFVLKVARYSFHNDNNIVLEWSDMIILYHLITMSWFNCREC